MAAGGRVSEWFCGEEVEAYWAAGHGCLVSVECEEVS